MVVGIHTQEYKQISMLHLQYFVNPYSRRRTQYLKRPLCFELVAEPVVWQLAVPRASHTLYPDYLPMNFQPFDLTLITFTRW